jgi:MFS transporter, AAHS family, 3-hydroxyphenylpropionic acid transporter
LVTATIFNQSLSSLRYNIVTPWQAREEGNRELSLTSTADATSLRRSGVTLALCFCAAVIEGMDLQSMGIAAPGIAPEFHLSKQALGQVLTASPLGLFFGAFIGGRLADFWGRRNALILSIIVFGAFQLATAWASGYLDLLAIRFLCGLGLGGAFPNLIALTAEAYGGRNNILNVVITAAGMPAGGAIASFIGFSAGPGGDWRTVFYVGGIAPLVLAPSMVILMPESSLFRQAKSAAASAKRQLGVVYALFDRSRVRQTILLWIAFFFTALVIHLLLNWMPNLMVAKGFTRPQAFQIQIVFNLGAAAGSVLLGWLMQRRPNGLLLFLCYAGLAAALLAITSLGNDLPVVATTAAVMGMCVVGSQFVLYGLSPAYYETIIRGTGTGAAVAASRLGSAVGPYLAGQLLGAGATATQVLQSLLPITGAAAAAAVLLMFLPRSTDLAS